MDLRAEQLINGSWTSPALDRLMAVMSSFDLWLPLIVVTVLLTAWRGRARARWFLLKLALTLAIGDGLVSQSLKRLVHRPRPYQEMAGVRQVALARHARPQALALFQPLEIKLSAPAGKTVDGRSFPSSHTMNNFAAATLLALTYRRRGWLAFFPAALVGYSRIYVGSHWLSDVLASAALASALGAAAWGLSAWARAKLAPCRPPRGPLV